MSCQDVRLLIVEDHPLYRKGLRLLLDGTPGLGVVAEAVDGAQAVVLAADLQPDVVLMDLQLPEQGGIAATREIVSTNPEIRVLVVTLFQDDDSVFAALRAGARGYILKDADEEEIVRAVRAVAAGESLFSPSVATRVLSWFSNVRPVAPEAFPGLTSREREILTLIAQGRSNAAIADDLSLSVKTVANN
ncbi:MAG TPA: response regulator transcription factor, partial [Thermomicrobiales bacterium]|nr:response regulator transcription factor [Thermomicrobiales bacterium]